MAKPDLRITFLATVPFVCAAAYVARFIIEPQSHRTSELIRNLPEHLRKARTGG